MKCAFCEVEIRPFGTRRFCSQSCCRKSFRKKFLKLNGVPYATALRNRIESRNPPKQKVKMRGGIYKQGDYWMAQVIKDGERVRKWFSSVRLGDENAHLAAALQRMIWLIEIGAWKRESSTGLGSFMDMMRGNADYQDSEIDGELAPWQLSRQ